MPSTGASPSWPGSTENPPVDRRRGRRPPRLDDGAGRCGRQPGGVRHPVLVRAVPGPRRRHLRHHHRPGGPPAGRLGLLLLPGLGRWRADRRPAGRPAGGGLRGHQPAPGTAARVAGHVAVAALRRLRATGRTGGWQLLLAPDRGGRPPLRRSPGPGHRRAADRGGGRHPGDAAAHPVPAGSVRLAGDVPLAGAGGAGRAGHGGGVDRGATGRVCRGHRRPAPGHVPVGPVPAPVRLGGADRPRASSHHLRSSTTTPSAGGSGPARRPPCCR